jgi:predicted lipid-binding transport protein (Tim44 family)
MLSAFSTWSNLLLRIAFVSVVLNAAAWTEVALPSQASDPSSTTSPSPAAQPTSTISSPSAPAAAPQGSAAQNPAAPEPATPEPAADDQGSMFVFKKDAEEVILHATVLDE